MFKYSKLEPVFILIILWQGISIAVDSVIFPSIVDIFSNLVNHLFEGELIEHLLITLYRVSIAFFITMLIGIFFGILMGSSKKIDKNLDFLLILGLNMPALVVIVICYIWFGLTDFAAILAVILNKVPIVIVNIREGVRAVESKYFQLAKIYKIEKKEIFFKIFLPQIYPYMMASTRLVLSLVWKIVLVVELLGQSNGVGFAISMFFQFFDITSILSYTLAFICIVLLIENFILKPIDRKINFWKNNE